MFKRVLILFLIFTIMCSMFVSVMGQGSSETYVDLVTENFNDIAGTLLSTKGWKANLALDEELSAEYKIADNNIKNPLNFLNLKQNIRAIIAIIIEAKPQY